MTTEEILEQKLTEYTNDFVFEAGLDLLLTEIEAEICIQQLFILLLLI